MVRLPTTDDIYEGFFIAKHTTIVVNIWYVYFLVSVSALVYMSGYRAMLRDPAVFLAPEMFIPDRWIGSNDGRGKVDPLEIVFGFGRR